MKGEERVCHVTEADRPRPPGCDPGVAPIREVSSCEAAVWQGSPSCGVLPLCAGGAKAIKRKSRASGGCLGTERR